MQLTVSEYLICVIFDIDSACLEKGNRCFWSWNLKFWGVYTRGSVLWAIAHLQEMQNFTFLHFQQLHEHKQETFCFLHLPLQGKMIRKIPTPERNPQWNLKWTFTVLNIWGQLFCKSHLRIQLILSLFIPTLHTFTGGNLWVYRSQLWLKANIV